MQELKRKGIAGLWNGQSLNAVAGLAFDFGSGAAMWAGNVFDLKKRVKLSPALAMEVTFLLPLHLSSASSETFG